VQVLHVSGAGKEFAPPPSHTPDGGAGASVPAYVVVPYVDRMALAYAAADLIVCRAGAGTDSEVTALGLAAAYVPLPIGNGEQRLNARPVVDAGGGLMVVDDACTPEWAAREVVPLLADRDRLATMGSAAAAFGRRDADERLADMIESAAKEERP
jgi:UDP-N-acetylglucosamine--N-acetylmuramyl-(pentapeptide) pyrophosphoryl-undecaprenol N-acetylglucosamine transferase